MHVTSDILPTKAIDIPRHHFLPAYRSMEIVCAGRPADPEPARRAAPSFAQRPRRALELAGSSWRTVPVGLSVAKAALAQAYPAGFGTPALDAATL